MCNLIFVSGSISITMVFCNVKMFVSYSVMCHLSKTKTLQAHSRWCQVTPRRKTRKDSTIVRSKVFTSVRKIRMKLCDSLTISLGRGNLSIMTTTIESTKRSPQKCSRVSWEYSMRCCLVRATFSLWNASTECARRRNKRKERLTAGEWERLHLLAWLEASRLVKVPQEDCHLEGVVWVAQTVSRSASRRILPTYVSRKT